MDRRWKTERGVAYPRIEEAAPEPNGDRVVYVVREPLLTDEKSEYIAHLYLAAPGRDPIQLTHGEHRDASPRWSPDGQYVAFVSNRSGKNNLYAMRLAGGEAWALTRYDKSDVAEPRWSPNGSRLAFLMREPPTEEREKALKAKDDARRFDFDDEFTQLYSVPFAMSPRQLPEAVQVTRGRRQVVGYDWLADSRGFALTHQPSPLPDTWTESRLATVSAGGPTELPSDGIRIADFGGRPVVSPDGAWIACVTSEQPPRWAFASRVVLYPTGGGEPRPLAATPDEQTVPVGWSADGQSVYVLDENGTGSRLLALPIDGGPPRLLSEASPRLGCAWVNQRDRIIYIAEDFDQPNAVYALGAAKGEPELVVQPALPSEWPEAPLPQAEVIRWTSFDGRSIEGILIYPLGYRPAQGAPRTPLIVHVHGGPTGVYQRGYLGAAEGYVDLAALAERGYAILQPNPRGSGGYGKDFRFANYGDWGGGDFQDILAGVDHLVARGLADSERLGIIGWSYGGYMTSWAITQTNRFKAACVGAGVTNLASFNGTADIPGFVPDYFGGEFWDDPETYRRHSPVFNAKSVRTPTLILHGEQDERVPLSQGREFYNALKRQGVPVELVTYPRAGHGPTEPRQVIDLRHRVLDWLDRWIAG